MNNTISSLWGDPLFHNEDLWLNLQPSDQLPGLDDLAASFPFTDQNKNHLLTDVQQAAQTLLCEFPTPISRNSPEASGLLDHRKRMWKMISVHELDYWNKNPQTLTAVIQAFEKNAPTAVVAEPEKHLKITNLLVRARIQVENLCKNLSTDYDNTLEQIATNLSFFEGILALMVQTNNSPTQMILPDTIFGGAAKVDLYGDSHSFVWNHKTLYCLAVPIAETQKTLKTRVWADWKHCDDNQKRSRVCLFVKPQDWQQKEMKFCLKAIQSQKTAGWRTFQVTLYQPKDKDKKTPQAPEIKSEDAAIIDRIKMIEQRLGVIEGKLL